MNSAPDASMLSMLVRRLETVGRLSEEERQAVAHLPAKTSVLAPDQDLIRDGDKPSQCCLVLDGWVYRYKLLDEGKRQILSFHVPGDIPDLQSLHILTMDHGVAALTKATVAFIPHESLLEVATRFPRIATLLWREALVDAAAFRQWVIGLGRRSAHARMAHLFCELYLKLEAVGLASDHRCSMPVSQIELADALGLSTVHVNRVLQELRSEGLITLSGRTLEIKAWASLVKTAEFDPTYLQLTKRIGE